MEANILEIYSKNQVQTAKKCISLHGEQGDKVVLIGNWSTVRYFILLPCGIFFWVGMKTCYFNAPHKMRPFPLTSRKKGPLQVYM